MIELSVVIPVLDEAASLPTVLPAVKEALKKMTSSYEILAIDGGSRDATAQIAEREGARVIRQKRPGYGGAIRDGFDNAQGEHILTMDGDGSHPAGMLPVLWARRWADLVIGSRYAPSGSDQRSWPRFGLSLLLNFATRWFLDFPVRDASSGLRLYRASAVRGLPLRGRDFTIQQETLAHILKAGGRVEEVPFHYDLRLGGESKARVLPLAFSYLRMLWELKALREGSWAAAAPALVLAFGLCTGLWGIGWGLPGPRRLRAFPPSLIPTPEIASEFAERWAKLYQDIRRSHEQMRAEEPVTYVKGVEEAAPGWSFPPGNLVNSYRSLLLQSENPDEKKSFIILSQMRPWRLEFKPLYAQYGGAFIYPLGAFLKLASWSGAVTLVADMRHYLMHPGDMGRLYLAGRIFVLAFHLGSLWLLYDMGRRLSGWPTGLAAALLFGLCPIVAVNSHLLKTHPYAAFWCLAGVRSTVLARQSGLSRDYLCSGFFAGAAAGANYSFFCFAAVPVLAWLSRGRPKAELGAALAAALAAAAVFFAFNPFLAFSFHDFAWELLVYPAHRDRWALDALWSVGRAAAAGMGPALSLTAAVGVAAALWRLSGGRGLLGAIFVAEFSILWLLLSRFWAFGCGVDILRFYYPLIGLACLLAADAIAALPGRALKAIALCAVLMDTGLRGCVYLENMRLDAGSLSTRMRCAEWIESRVPGKASVGLVRYPEPAHTPPFRYDRYRLVIFEKPELLAARGYPDYLVVDEQGKGLVAELARARYQLLASFEPWRAGWARVEDDSFFADAPMYVYKLKGPVSI